MSPKPQGNMRMQPNMESNTGASANGERVVISGMAGLYPQARYIKDLKNILYNKINPISSDDLRWNCNHPEVPQYGGFIPELDRFDAQFFKVHYKLGCNMDPMSRKILEQTYEAIYDAGMSPEHLSGKKVGVYVGSCFSESEKTRIYASANDSGLGVAGCNKSMFANRISYWLNVKGPSVAIDQACCSSTAALEAAYKAITHGDCEAAVVGGACLCLHPQSSVHLGRIMNISMDGKTKSFAEDANGCAKSEAVNVLFLQKAKDAKRIYADVIYVQSEFLSLSKEKSGPKYGFYRNPDITVNFLKNFYKVSGVPPSAVEYVEAFGSAVPEADKSELDAIDKVFCDKRERPLLIGSVLSNIGYGEAASGISAVTKVLLGYHEGTLASNLHYESPRSDVAGVREKRMCVLTENTPFRRTYAAVNGMSVTGVNAHVLLHGHYKHKDLNRYKCNIPRLVTISGRQEEAVVRALDILKSHPIDPEELALLHSIHETNISGHLGKGYSILDTNSAGETKSLGQCVEYCDGARRPLWFVYSGMGSQWAGMGAQLMRIPIFAAAIERCRKVLEPKGLDIVHIITTPDKTIFDNILHSFVGIAAVQIGLTDILAEMGLVPDNIIGHSVGELGCAYADGCLTAEEMILSAYSRGRVSLETPFIRGSMAAVGLGAKQMALLCPPEITVACHNSSESCTISGPADIMRTFVAGLTAKDIFAKEVPCSNIAYHSQYIAEAGPGLLKYLKEVIKEPKPRSSRWISSSVPQKCWEEPVAKYSSAEYHTNNLLSPVLFEEASSLIPSDAVLVEVAPHGLLQAILKRALPTSTTNIPLTRRGHADNVIMILDAIGKLYLHGYNPKVRVLYPRVEFPVSTGTPFLSHYVQWAHQEKWLLPLFVSAKRTKTASRTFMISIHDNDYSYLKGHVIGNKTLIPFSFVLVAVWDTLAMSLDVSKKSISVKFTNVKLYVNPILHERKSTRLSVALHRGSGMFEVMNENSKVATGYITVTDAENYGKASKLNNIQTIDQNEQENTKLNFRDVYGALYERGYNYSGDFCSILSTNINLSEGKVLWKNNWVTVIDGIIQLQTLKNTYSGIAIPEHIGSMVIDPRELSTGEKLAQSRLHITLSDAQERARCDGVIIENIRFRQLRPESNGRIILETPQIVPRYGSNFDGMWSGENVLPLKETIKNKESVMLQSEVLGDINSLQWKKMPPLSGNGILVAVEFASINMRDMRQAFGLNSNTCNNKYHGYGMEFSGVTERGDRVMGLLANGAVSSHVLASLDLLWPVPEHWTLEDAATVPLAYVFAYYCLNLISAMRLKSKHVQQNTVLVHGGAGALGQAIISIALARGWRVFTTVRDQGKKRFLLRLFPQLNEDCIFNSRDATFGDKILNVTNGLGCNYVISNVKGDLKNVTFKCCGPSSIMIDTVQILSSENFMLGMNNLTNERSYMAIEISSIFEHLKPTVVKKLHELVSEGIVNGEVRPLTCTTFARDETARAFRLLSASNHRGRTLIRIRDEAKSSLPKRITTAETACHVVICDSNPLGVQIVDKLIESGIKLLQLHFTSSASHLQFKLGVWKKKNIKVVVEHGHLGDINDLLSKASKLGPVESVHIVAFNSMPEVVLQKLDKATRSLCPSLKYFVVLSNDVHFGSATCVDRAINGLPATFLDMSMIKPFQDPLGAKWYRGAVDAVERAWHNEATILRAVKEDTQSQSIIQTIAALTRDAYFPHMISVYVTGLCGEIGDKSLEDLGLPLEKSPIPLVSSILRDFYNTYVEDEEIPQLTINRLKDIEKSVTDIHFENKPVHGLDIFYSFIDDDELLASSEVVHMPTLATNRQTRDDEFDGSTSLCIVPGLEGLHLRFRELCEQLKLTAFVLHPGLDQPYQTPQELARKHAQTYLKMNLQSPFYILGYETGVTVALEMAAILEDNGMTGTVFCMGDGPAETQALLERELATYSTEAALQKAVALHMFKLMSHDAVPVPLDALRDSDSWSTRKEACVRALLGHVPYSAQYTHALLEAAYARIVAARLALPPPRTLRSRIVLLRARHDHKENATCSLQQYTQSKPVVEELDLSVAHLISDMRPPAIINSHLDENVLLAFDEKNLCDSNNINAEIFME